MKKVASSAALILALANSLGAQAPGSTDRMLRVTVGIMMPDNTVRAIPRHRLELIYTADSAQRIVFQTGLMGGTSEAIPPGKYHLRSLEPASVNDSTYSWDVPITIGAGNDSLELTNTNAIVKYFKRIPPERLAFDKVRGGVFRVESGLNHGTGFLVKLPGDIRGIIVTNDHIISSDSFPTASVYIDSVTRVPAVVIARDHDADIALIRIPNGRCADCTRLTLAAPAAGGQVVAADDRVLVVGFAPGQPLSYFPGVATGVRDNVISTAVGITPDNSGGPMLNLAGDVIGVSTYGGASAAGASGAIAFAKSPAILKGLTSTSLAGIPGPADRAMPAPPIVAYANPLAANVMDGVDFEPYRKLLAMDADHFWLDAATPMSYRVAQKMVAAGDPGPKEGDYNWDAVVKEWDQYVGDSHTPVVAISVLPKSGEGDVRSLHFYRNGVEVEPVRGSTFMKPKLGAHFAYYLLPPEAFEPDSMGTPARVHVVIQDTNHPEDLSERDIEGDVSANIWNDFKPLFVATPKRQFIAAIGVAKSPEVKLKCASDGTCKIEP